MGKKLYKYIGPDLLDVVFEDEDYCGLKCSYPKDYNDPYELFLSIDFNQPPEMLAYFKESIGEIPQHPTTCFSKSPIVIPMWAHYAHNSKGFVLEIDEDLLAEHIEGAQIEDVTYNDKANPDMIHMMQRAHGTMKPRHTIFFWQAMMHAAYFTKQRCWSYEEERRLFVKDEDIQDKNGNMILYIPTHCISSIIAGPRVSSEYIEKAKELRKEISCAYYEMKIGKSNAVPYFLDEDNYAYRYEDEGMVLKEEACPECYEPFQEGVEYEDACGWCSINSEHLQEAKERNPMNYLAATGGLERYLDSIKKMQEGD